MTVLALTSTQENLWWGAIIGGFVVLIAVAVLLTILVLLVRTIDRRVVMIRDTLQQAADEHGRHGTHRRDRGEGRRHPRRGPRAPPLPRPSPRKGPLMSGVRR